MNKIKIEVYSHGVRISNYSETLFQNLSNFIKRLTLREPVKIPKTNRIVMEERKRYYGLTEDKKELFIHRYCLDDFLDELANLNIDPDKYEIIHIPVPESKTVNYKLDAKYKLRDYQLKIKEDILRPISSARVDLQTGLGKFLRNGTPIKVPGSWQSIETLKIGDSVIAQDGSVTKVSGVYPQGQQPLVRVTLSDVRTIDCGLEHLWKIGYEVNGELNWQIANTKDIIELMRSTKVYIPLIQSAEGIDLELPIEPFKAGKQLRATIPNDYLESSHKQRLELFKGMLDNPTIYVNNEFVINCLKMAYSIVDLIRSLGYLAKVTVDSEGYKVNWTDEPKAIQITNITKTNEGEATCISVEHPDKLYVAKDYVVTHNTLTSLATLAAMNTRLLVMIPPKYFGLWVKALDETFNDIEGRYITVSGSDAFKDLINNKDKYEHVDVIIISNVTYRTYIEAYEKHNGEIDTVGYSVNPFEFHKHLGIGCQINDEIQEDPGLLFRIDIFSNVEKQIYLSATPYTGNSFVTKMINKMLPDETKVRLPDLDVYINCLGLVYNELGIRKTDYLTPFKNTYNHARYETRMLLNETRTNRYFNMVKKMVDGLFAKDREPNQKMLILCSTVNFIKSLVGYLKEQYPDLEINEHVSGSSYLRLLTNDITVSTIKSSGTGVDIPDLREVLLLQGTDSKKDRIQILGRLRRLKSYPDTTPRLTYVINENIPHHLRYHDNSQRYFKNRLKSFNLKRITM